MAAAIRSIGDEEQYVHVRTAVVVALLMTFALGVLPAQAQQQPAGGPGTEVQLAEPAARPAPDRVQRYASRTAGYIVNGRPVNAGDHPYVALLHSFDPKTGEIDGECTGTLIAARWVLTAKHCTRGVTAMEALLDFDQLAKTTSAERRLVDRMVTAPGGSDNDVALLRLEARSRVTPAAVASGVDDHRTMGGTPARIVGWGDRDEAGAVPDRKLEGDVDVLGTDACYDAFDSLFSHTSMLCGGGLVNDVCFGDSGGPLLVRDAQWRVIGVTSFGKTCSPDDPSVYMRVSQFRSWIEDVTGITAQSGTPLFSDLDRRNRHFDAVVMVVDADIADGLSDGTYRPDRDVTRAQMATFLARALKLPTNGIPSFPDVDGSYAHAGAIAAVADAGVTTGQRGGTFGPTEPVTRAQMATFLTRALDLPAGKGAPFRDVAGRSEQGRAVAAVAAADIAGGYDDGTYRPTRPVTRAQMGSFLARGFDLVVTRPSR